jgi:hypothetical protein
MALAMSTNPIGIRGPYLSQKGPKANLMKIVPVTAAMDEDHISLSDIFSVAWTSDNNGVIENLTKEG